MVKRNLIFANSVIGRKNAVFKPGKNPSFTFLIDGSIAAKLRETEPIPKYYKNVRHGV